VGIFFSTPYSIYFTDSNTGWVVGSYGTIIKTTNGGTNWFSQNSGTTNVLYSVYFIDSNTGWAVGSNGTVLRTSNGGGVTSIDDKYGFSELKDFILYQNYPNPFGKAIHSDNPSTKISWHSPVSSHQTLKIYDILGNEVASLVDEFRQVGIYEIEFNAVETRRGVSLPSGIYFYKLQVGDLTETKKMILIR
jgi:hypothetical protein